MLRLEEPFSDSGLDSGGSHVVGIANSGRFRLQLNTDFRQPFLPVFSIRFHLPFLLLVEAEAELRILIVLL